MNLITNALQKKKSLVQAGGTAQIWNTKRTLKWPQQDNQSENVNVCKRQLQTVSNYLREKRQAERFTLKH